MDEYDRQGRWTAARGALALLTMLGAARLPERLARPGLAMAERLAPPEPVLTELHIPAQRQVRTESGRASSPLSART